MKAIENLNGSVATYIRNVKQWRGGSMLARWVSASVLDASQRFRRVRGDRDLAAPALALQKIEDEQEDAPHSGRVVGRRSLAPRVVPAGRDLQRGTSWPPDVVPDARSRTRRSGRDLAGLPSEPSTGLHGSTPRLQDARSRASRRAPGDDAPPGPRPGCLRPRPGPCSRWHGVPRAGARGCSAVCGCGSAARPPVDRRSSGLRPASGTSPHKEWNLIAHAPKHTPYEPTTARSSIRRTTRRRAALGVAS